MPSKVVPSKCSAQWYLFTSTCIKIQLKYCCTYANSIKLTAKYFTSAIFFSWNNTHSLTHWFTLWLSPFTTTISVTLISVFGKNENWHQEERKEQFHSFCMCKHPTEHLEMIFFVHLHLQNFSLTRTHTHTHTHSLWHTQTRSNNKTVSTRKKENWKYRNPEQFIANMSEFQLTPEEMKPGMQTRELYLLTHTVSKETTLRSNRLSTHTAITYTCAWANTQCWAPRNCSKMFCIQNTVTKIALLGYIFDTWQQHKECTIHTPDGLLNLVFQRKESRKLGFWVWNYLSSWRFHGDVQKNPAGCHDSCQDTRILILSMWCFGSEWGFLLQVFFVARGNNKHGKSSFCSKSHWNWCASVSEVWKIN